MVDTINNSLGVLAALNALQSANSDLAAATARTSSGLKVATASDDPVAYQGSANMTGEVNSLKAVTLSLSRAQSVSDVSIAAGGQVSKLLIDMKATVASAMAADLSPSQRQAYDLQFQQQRDTLVNFIQNASFDNTNVLNGSKPNGVSFLADSDATQSLSLKGRDFLPGGAIVSVSSTDTLSSIDAAQHVYDEISASITNVGGQLADMGLESKRIDAQIGFVAKLSDALTEGVGSLVDSDMVGDSALIKALQVKQSLSAQAISIANNAPQTLLALFRP